MSKLKEGSYQLCRIKWKKKKLSEQSDNKIHQNLIQTIKSMLAHDLQASSSKIEFYFFLLFFVRIIYHFQTFATSTARTQSMSCVCVLRKQCQFGSCLFGILNWNNGSTLIGQFKSIRNRWYVQLQGVLTHNFMKYINEIRNFLA